MKVQILLKSLKNKTKESLKAEKRYKWWSKNMCQANLRVQKTLKI